MRQETAVLIVDSDPSVCAGLRMALTLAGYIAFTAPDLDQALRVAARHRPDLFIIDSHLTTPGSEQVIRKMADGHPGRPIIAVSTNTEYHTRMMAAGACRFISKPLDMAVLLAAVSAASPVLDPQHPSGSRSTL